MRAATPVPTVSDHRIDVEDQALRLIAFDRPEVRNAFDSAMYRAVDDALGRCPG